MYTCMYMYMSSNVSDLHHVYLSCYRSWRQNVPKLYMYMYIHVHVHTCTCTYMYMYIHVHVHTCTCTYMYMYIHVHVHTCTCTYMYMHISVHTCTCTHQRTDVKDSLTKNKIIIICVYVEYMCVSFRIK